MRKFFLSLLYSALVLVLVVIVLGAYTRLSDAGLGCPDWPGCYGNMMVPDAVNAEIYQRPLEAAKAWKEMIHRYAAGTLGLLILLIFSLSQFFRKQIQLGVFLPLVVLATVVFQALLGMWTVTHLLSPIIVTSHLLGGFATLSLLWWMLLRYRNNHQNRDDNSSCKPTSSSLGLFSLAALFLLVLQIFLGGWTSTNYAALACGNTFPTCQGIWTPEQNFTQGFNFAWQKGVDYEFGKLEAAARTAIHFTHRIGALVVFLFVGMLAIRSLRYELGLVPKVVLVLLVTQVCLGVLNVVLSLPLTIAVAHTLIASLLLLSVINLKFDLFRLNPEASEN